jgi:NADH-quinone oxidoreductase subunit G
MSAEPEQTVEMVNIDVDGVTLQVPKGAMIIEATDKAGIEIPRFCYHPKLSIAANCRMCLVDVEKMPKPVPACATPVMEGMKVYTDSRRAMDAQHGVMEFLLINHPLDCPICDQGGECELQDLAMGYGRSVSRFTERKRVVKDKNVGPLVQTEMTRCIHCTRCVRFLEEIAGTSEMGGAGRGDRLEIGTCVENSIDSELSGNIIDLCPVGALTNKPYRFAARAWELTARPSVAVHDGVGSCLFYHVRNGRILRAVPRENEATNETWLSDRDRFSHLGLYADDRALVPQVKEEGQWKAVSWDEAIGRVAGMLRSAADDDGADQIGFLMSSSALSEEHYLAQSLARQLGCHNIDHRLREQDFADDAAGGPAPALAGNLAAIEGGDAILLVGCNPREEAPLVGHRIRQAWRKGAAVSVINPLDWPFTFDTSLDAIVAPQDMVGELAALATAVEAASSVPVPAHLQALTADASGSERHRELASRLVQAGDGQVLLGQFAMSHPDAACLRGLGTYVAEATGCALSLLAHGGNPGGAWRAGAVPHRGPGGATAGPGLNVAQMLEEPRKLYFLWDFEPDFDLDNPGRAMGALRQAGAVIAVTSFAGEALREVADVILPLAPAAESEGSIVNLNGETMTLKPAGAPGGQSRPGWKILRRLGGELRLQGFDQTDIGEVHAQMQSALAAEAPAPGAVELAARGREDGLYRVGETPMYSVDATTRRSAPLQETAQADSAFLGLNPDDAAALGLADGATARVSQGEGEAELTVRISERVPPGAAWLRTVTGETRALGHAVAPLKVEVA